MLDKLKTEWREVLVTFGEPIAILVVFAVVLFSLITVYDLT